MSTWLKSLIRRGTPDGEAAVLEMLVLEGADAGEVFTVDGEEVLIGRRLPDDLKARGILLKDSTVSAKQALLRRKGQVFHLESLPGATNVTLINKRPANGQKVKPGARIQIGRVVIEVREREGMALGTLARTLKATRSRDQTRDVSAADQSFPTEQLRVPSFESTDADTTEFRAVISEVGRLIVERGFSLVQHKSFPILSGTTTLGRSHDSDLCVADMGVSRCHAELIWENEQLALHHYSKVNPTLLNSCEVLDNQMIRDGDVIQLADQLILRVELDEDRRREMEKTEPGASAAVERADSADDIRRRTLRQEMEDKVARDQRIEEEYSVEGSFLDVDVVNSYGMKAETSLAAHIVVSFERFRGFVLGVVEEFNGHVLNSNGDELMCYFESTLDSVRAGDQILRRLEGFNREGNLLSSPFRFRIGIHTGKSLVDLNQGIAYSAILDIAGHLQKLAEENGLVISQGTLENLPEGLPFEYAGTMEREGLAYHRLTGEIS